MTMKMDWHDDDVAAACVKYGLRKDDAFLLKDMACRDPSGWPACCGSDCSPCTDDIIAAAIELKKLKALRGG